MRIGVLAQPLLEPSAGITYFTKGILDELIKQDKKDTFDLFLFRLFPKSKIFMFGRQRKNFRYRYQRLFPFKVYYKLHKWGINIPLELFFGSHDLYFFPNFTLYPHRRGRSVVVVHDLSFEKVPQFVFKKNVEFLQKFVPPSVAQADRVVAISQNTKQDLIETYGVPEKKISIVNPGVDLKVFKPQSESEIAKVKKKYGIERPFVLYLGTLDPRKNVAALVRAYAALRDQGRYQLVLAGKVGWMHEKRVYGEVFEVVGKLGLKDDVVFTGYVPDEDRPKLLSACEVFVFPSLFEGFGMPVVEAQACGAPVVTSNVTSLPEAGGNGALYVEPTNLGQLTRALEDVLGKPALRESLRKKGLANARRHTWAKSAKKMMKVFESVSSL
ncbi:glycosyltransferase [Candidatus Saccharibacteria bacterium]|nr:glycosyltransferase [Candidatus Saccharibacteria bacterium]